MRKTLIIIIWLAAVAPAHAQFGGAIIVSDPAVEAATAAIQQFTGDSAYSLLTGGCGGVWAGQAQNLNAMMQIMASGVADPQTFGALYVGYEDPGPQAIYQAEQITQKTLNTGASALGVIQAQTANFQAEDAAMAAIEGCSTGATAMLAALQANTESNLAVAQQLQLTRQLLMTLINVAAVSNSEVLNEKTQIKAANAVNLNGGVLP